MLPDLICFRCRQDEETPAQGWSQTPVPTKQKATRTGQIQPILGTFKCCFALFLFRFGPSDVAIRFLTSSESPTLGVQTCNTVLINCPSNQCCSVPVPSFFFMAARPQTLFSVETGNISLGMYVLLGCSSSDGQQYTPTLEFFHIF